MQQTGFPHQGFGDGMGLCDGGKFRIEHAAEGEQVVALVLQCDAQRANALWILRLAVVRAKPDQIGFAVQPRRCVVERFFAWINRNRRLAKDFEATVASANAFLYAASIMLLTRRLGRSQ